MRDVAAQLTVSLTPSDYNGYNITCFGKKNGTIDATVSGGTPPYTYAWSNQSTDEDLADLASGFYRLVVTDALNEVTEAEITLTEPTALRLGAEPFKYPNGLNLSCHDCYNGGIDITVTDGVPPYSYDWGDEVYSQDRTGLGSLAYQVTVIDANGCNVNSERITLTQPERSDWRMDGNANTDPALHYFGTSDAQDAVFKSNGQERLRLLSTGGVKLTGLGGGGILKGGGDGLIQVLPDVDLQGYIQGVLNNPNLWELEPFWKTNGNTLENQQQTEAFIGSVDNHPLRFRTNNVLRMNLTQGGDLGVIQRMGVGFDLIQNTLGNGASRLNIREYQGRWLRLSEEDDNHWLVSSELNLDAVASLTFKRTVGASLGGPTAMMLYADGGAQLGPNLRVSSVGDVSIARSAGGNWLSLHQDQLQYPSSYFGIHNPTAGGRLEFYYQPSGDGITMWKILNLHENGKVSLGDVSVDTPNSNYRLFVEGGILTEKVRVALKYTSQWSDHVFGPGYQLLGLDDLSAYIKSNAHLPGVPTADCMVEEGLDVVSTSAILLEKIEELTLYLIQAHERIKMLELDCENRQKNDE